LDGTVGKQDAEVKIPGPMPTPVGGIKGGCITLPGWTPKSLEDYWDVDWDGIPLGCLCEWSRSIKKRKYCCKAKMPITKYVADYTTTDGELEEVDQRWVKKSLEIKYRCRCEFDPDGKPVNPPVFNKPPQYAW
jgi:hypothetical protein